jgi:Tfp pilus assembly protein PilX
VEKDCGVALILALLVLSFLTVLGTAILTTSTVDIWISDNYKSATQSLYLAEAGIDDGREMLRASGRSLTEWLSLSSDGPLIPSQGSGSYEVRIRNDNADGPASLTDTNEVVTLISTGYVNGSRKTIEASIQKGKFPEDPGDLRLASVIGLENLAGSIRRNANEVFSGPDLRDMGAPGDYRVVVVEGDLELGPGTGYGLLLVRGDLTVAGDIVWNGLLAVIGKGIVVWGPGVSGTVNGGLFIAKTKADDGSLLAVPADVAYTITDAAQIRAANQQFPYNPIALREW